MDPRQDANLTHSFSLVRSLNRTGPKVTDEVSPVMLRSSPAAIQPQTSTFPQMTRDIQVNIKVVCGVCYNL